MDQFRLHLGPLERVHQRNGNVDTCRIKTNNSVATSHTFQRRNRNKTIDACMKLAQNVKNTYTSVVGFLSLGNDKNGFGQANIRLW